jgi:hypothetical protein
MSSVELKIGLGFAEVIFNNANCQTVETFQRAPSSYFGEGIGHTSSLN